MMVGGDRVARGRGDQLEPREGGEARLGRFAAPVRALAAEFAPQHERQVAVVAEEDVGAADPLGQDRARVAVPRSEEHTSELQSLMRLSYAIFCLKKKTTTTP